VALIALEALIAQTAPIINKVIIKYGAILQDPQIFLILNTDDNDTGFVQVTNNGMVQYMQSVLSCKCTSLLCRTNVEKMLIGVMSGDILSIFDQ